MCHANTPDVVWWFQCRRRYSWVRQAVSQVLPTKRQRNDHQVNKWANSLRWTTTMKNWDICEVFDIRLMPIVLTSADHNAPHANCLRWSSKLAIVKTPVSYRQSWTMWLWMPLSIHRQTKENAQDFLRNLRKLSSNLCHLLSMKKNPCTSLTCVFLKIKSARLSWGNTDTWLWETQVNLIIFHKRN